MGYNSVHEPAHTVLGLANAVILVVLMGGQGNGCAKPFVAINNMNTKRIEYCFIDKDSGMVENERQGICTKSWF